MPDRCSSHGHRRPNRFPIIIVAWIVLFVLDLGSSSRASFPTNPHVIKLSPSQSCCSRRGGIVVGDLDADSRFDYVVSTQQNDVADGKATMVAYSHFGTILWSIDDIDLVLSSRAEINGLPGHHGPGVAIADIDGNGQSEVIHLNNQNDVVIRRGNDGTIIKKINVVLPDESLLDRFEIFSEHYGNGTLKKGLRYGFSRASKWSHFQVVNLEGTLDNEIILQANPLPFRWLKAVSLATGKTLWSMNRYIGASHGGFRAADVDGDGFDEVLGGLAIDHDGSVLNAWRYRKIAGHFDSLLIADVLPEHPGIEWILTEESHEGDDRTALLSTQEILFYHSHHGLEPQNAAVGEFDPAEPGLEIWLRSRFKTGQTPWVIGSGGNTLTTYKLIETMPPNWSHEGIEVISPINWDGGKRQYIAAKERHVDGKIAILDPMTGNLINAWEEEAARIYVADVAGDSREEIIVLNSAFDELRIYWNEAAGNDGDFRRPWELNHYQRQKMNHNYYSP